MKIESINTAIEVQVEPNVFVDQKAKQNCCCANFFGTSDDRCVNVNQRDEKVSDDQHEMDC